MTDQKTTSPLGMLGGLLGLVVALSLFGPCAKPAPRWTNEGDGSFDTYRKSESAKEEIRKDLERRLKIEKDVGYVLDALNDAQQK
jgi:hypothetical protein